MVIPKLSELIHCDPDHEVVMAALELYAELLKELKGFVLQGQGHKEAIINCIRDVLKCNVSCYVLNTLALQNISHDFASLGLICKIMKRSKFFGNRIFNVKSTLTLILA